MLDYVSSVASSSSQPREETVIHALFALRNAGRAMEYMDRSADDLRTVLIMLSEDETPWEHIGSIHRHFTELRNFLASQLPPGYAQAQIPPDSIQPDEFIDRNKGTGEVFRSETPESDFIEENELRNAA